MFTFFDVETPNRKNDRICSIGVIKVAPGGEVINRSSFLVNPEVSFDDFNIRLTGVCPADVKNSPSFEELWEDCLRDLFVDSIVVAHNAIFDMSVLSKTLMGYGYDKPKFRYLCTKEMACEIHPEFDNYKLPTVCDQLGIKMGRHHLALDDVEACYQIFRILVDQVPYIGHIHTYAMGEGGGCRRTDGRQRTFNSKTEAFRGLIEMAECFLSENAASYGEAIAILDYINGHADLADDPTVSKIRDIVAVMAMDGGIDAQESSSLRYYFEVLKDPLSHTYEFDGDCAGKVFCLSGNFEHGARSEIERLIESNGGICIQSVTKKCNYVVVGSCGNDAWAMKKYGTKVKKAMDWRAKGVDIKVIGENDLGLWE